MTGEWKAESMFIVYGPFVNAGISRDCELLLRIAAGYVVLRGIKLLHDTMLARFSSHRHTGQSMSHVLLERAVVVCRNPLFGKMLPHAVGVRSCNAEEKHAGVCAQRL